MPAFGGWKWVLPPSKVLPSAYRRCDEVHGVSAFEWNSGFDVEVRRVHSKHTHASMSSCKCRAEVHKASLTIAHDGAWCWYPGWTGTLHTCVWDAAHVQELLDSRCWDARQIPAMSIANGCHLPLKNTMAHSSNSSCWKKVLWNFWALGYALELGTTMKRNCGPGWTAALCLLNLQHGRKILFSRDKSRHPQLHLVQPPL